MKTNAVMVGFLVLLSACSGTKQRHINPAPVQEQRVSDQYSREAVKSYEVFEAKIQEHVIVMMELVTGEHFPMLCRKTGNGLYPIPQSVFVEPGKEQWNIMCEPRIGNAHALMRLEISRVNGALFIGNARLKPSAKTPLLFNLP